MQPRHQFPPGLGGVWSAHKLIMIFVALNPFNHVNRRYSFNKNRNKNLTKLKGFNSSI